MNRKPSRRSTSVQIESLENRTLFSSALHSALIADAKAASNTTKTTLTAKGGDLGQGVTLTVTVRAAASFGAPTGTVAIASGGPIATVTLAPTTSTNAKYDLSSGTFSFPAGAGDAAPYFGSYTVTATYTSTGALASSQAKNHFTVKKPKFTKEVDGLEIATVEAGSGAAIAAGQTASMFYTGYLYKGGSIFDDSADHPPVTPFQFIVDDTPEQVIPGFDQGTVGMQVGETRVLVIPAALGYGSTAQGSIPANSELVFLITLEGIS